MLTKLHIKILHIGDGTVPVPHFSSHKINDTLFEKIYSKSLMSHFIVYTFFILISMTNL